MKNVRNSKISLVSLMAMFGVVWWHCYCGSDVEKWFIPAFCVWSVPWFFFVSGMLFFRSVRTKGAFDALKGKMRSLVVPYCAWSVIGLVISWPLVSYNGIASVFAVTPRAISTLGNTALWYVRTLLVFSLVAGVIHPFANRLGRWSRLTWAALFLLSWYCILSGGR